MNMKKAVAAAFGAALLTASTGAAGHAVLDKNKSVSATQAPKATGGAAKASLKGTSKVSSKASAKSAIISGGGSPAITQKGKSSNKGGKAAAHNQGGSRTGSQQFKIG